MAASVSYRINGNFDGKAFSSAQKSMKNLASAAKTFNTAVKGFVVGKVFQGVKSMLNGAEKSFMENNKAQSQLFKSLQNNAKTATGDIRSLVKEIDGMSGYFGGSDLVNGANVLANLGLDEDQIRKTMQAAKDMAASGIMPLQQAVENLGKSYNGNIATLKKTYPELANFTEEELKNGAAVDALAQKYKGFEDSMKKTFTGMDSQYSNSLDGVKSACGEIVKAFKYLGQEQAIPVLDKISGWFAENETKIIGIILGLPDIMKISLDAIWKMIQRTFTADGLSNLFSFFKTGFETFSGNMIDIAVTLFKTLANVIKGFFENLSAGNLKDLCWNALNKFNDIVYSGFAKLIDVPTALAQGNWSDAAEIIKGNKKGATGQFIEERLFKADYRSVDLTKSLDAMKNEAANGMKEIAGIVKKNWTEQKGNITKFASNYSDIANEMTNNIKNIVDGNAEKAQELLGEIRSDTGSIRKDNEKTDGTGGSDDFYSFEEVEVSSLMESLTVIFKDLGELLSQIKSLKPALFAINKELKERKESIQKTLKTIQKKRDTPAFSWDMFSHEYVRMKPDASLLPSIKQTFLDLLNWKMEFLEWTEGVCNDIKTKLEEAGFPELVSQMIASLVADMESKSEAFSKVLNLFSTFADAVNNSNIVEMVNRVFTPLADIIVYIGAIVGELLEPLFMLVEQIFSPLLNFLTALLALLYPIMSVVGTFLDMISFLVNLLDLFNPILSVFTFLIGKALETLTTFANGFIAMWNNMVRVLNSIEIFGWHPFNMAEKDYIKDSHETPYGGYTIDPIPVSNEAAYGASGKNPSYTAARDIYVQVHFDHSYVNGDSREIAVMLRDEIRAAEALGY